MLQLLQIFTDVFLPGLQLLTLIETNLNQQNQPARPHTTWSIEARSSARRKVSHLIFQSGSKEKALAKQSCLCFFSVDCWTEQVSALSILLKAGRSVTSSRLFQLLMLAIMSVALFGLFHMSPFSHQLVGHRTGAGSGFRFGSPLVGRHLIGLDWALDSRGRKAETLVVYTFSNTDAEYKANLQFFVSEAMQEDDGCHYIVVVQQEANGKPVLDLPDVPSNARYEFHYNTCYDYGTVGWLLEQGKMDPGKYRYFVFVNSSVRGPFLPAYWPKERHWTAILTSRLSDNVKLVGPAISCEGAHRGGEFASIWRINPHVQSYVMATDQVGMALLMEDGTVFRCHADFHDTIYYSELGASALVLEAGKHTPACGLTVGPYQANLDNL
ncbi:hypothetical protein WJX84_002990 [Apatococcus fuscideae]|uniref:Uncharacterized protein n=1 Tax=Apatococcus fuscideae TaxID=2026836 RepID=A0AAW1SVE4_9CHLO